tara:strand:+ start:8776 stop:9807 length:1032 start_codon:yes stop_codon:yes gene_type:complete
VENSIWQLLESLKPKKGVTEVIINSPDNVYIEKEGDLIRLNVEIKPSDFDTFCHEVATQNQVKFGYEHPIVDGILPDGSRINIISNRYTDKFPAITIRKYLKNIRSFDELEGKFLISEKWIRFFKSLVAARVNIIVSGGTGCGKTTFLNLLLNELSPLERIITIEDTRELSFKSPNHVRLYTAMANSGIENPLQMRDLVKNTLRMRPDRIIVGEVRGAEAFDMLQAMNTGHDGSMCTLHANSPVEALARLENLFLFAGFEVPVNTVRKQISSAVDFIIQLDRNENGERIVSEVLELTRMEGQVISSQKIGMRSELALEFSGIVPACMKKLIPVGLESDFFVEI